MADTVLQSEGFPYTGDFNTSKWPRGLTPSGASARVVGSGRARGSGNAGRLTTAPIGNYSETGAVSRRFSFADVQGRNVEFRGSFRWPSTRECVARFYTRSNTPNLIWGTTGIWLEVVPTTGRVFIGGTTAKPSLNMGRLVVNRWYTFRLRVTGTLLRAKIWDFDTGKEPADWQLVTNDSASNAPGYVAGGVALLPGRTAQATYLDVDELYVFTALEAVPALPRVNAGSNAITPIGSLYGRTGTASGTGTLRWSWSMLSRPSGSTAALTGGAPLVRFTPDVVGNYVLRATVTDPLGQVGTSQFTVTAAPKSALGGRLVMGDDDLLVASRHRTWTGSAWTK